MLKRLDWFLIVMAFLLATGCGGGGCGGCAAFQPIPGGFPAAKREPNAAQIRLSSHGITKLEADPAKLVSGLLNGPLEFNVPGSCGTLDICCPNGNTPSAMCGPVRLNIDNFAGQNGARLELNPQSNQLQVVLRPRIKTVNDIPAQGFGATCNVDFDTERTGQKDVEVIAPITFSADPTSGTTRVVVGDLTINRLEENDFVITGTPFICDAADWGIQYFLGPLKDAIAGPVRDAVQDQTCKQCLSGDVNECGTFATACTNNVCMQGNSCMQELGVSGRIAGQSLLAGFSPGTTGAMDLYEVAGGDGEGVGGGMSLFLLGGMQPGGVPRDRCGPPAADPGLRGIARNNIFRANEYQTQPFDFGIGIHKNQLEQMAYAAYDGGLLCLTLTSGTVAQLSTDTLSLVSRSLGNLNEGNAPMAVGLRPQSPPVMTLGLNTFTDDGMGNSTLTDPLITVKFTALEIDFFASVDDQYIRVFTVVADVELPIGLQVTAQGELAPVIGDVANAFTNISVKNSEAVAETPAELAGLFPTILNLVLPQLSSALSPIALPSFAGLTITPTAITSVDNKNFLAIFANLTLGMMPAPVHTTAAVAEVLEAPESVARRPSKWRGNTQPSVKLALGGNADGLEYSYRIDRGTWSAWSKNPNPTVSSNVFWLPGTHRIEVRARQLGKPHTIDETPVQLDVVMGASLLRSAPARPFHGQPGEAGCNCSTSGDPVAALPFALVFGLVVLPLRRVRRAIRRAAKRRAFTTLVLFIAIALMASLPGCSCGSSNPCGDVECLPGEVTPGGLGRWTSMASDDTRVLVATYDQNLGDLVVIDVTDPAAPKRIAVDGIPTDVPAVYDPSGYRGGIEEPGPNVGAWTSIAISNGLAKVAYQDRENGTLKYAHETKLDKWESYTITDGSGGEEIGRYAHLIIDSNGNPAIAYISTGNDDGTGHRTTDLRIVRASESEPGEGSWTVHRIATGIGSCAGLCTGGEVCIDKPEGQTCAVTSSDCTTACATTEACVAGACTPKREAPTMAELAGGTGLFASLVQLPDGRLAVAYYDRANRALAIAVESGAGTNEFVETRLHEGAGDRGMWTSAVVDGQGTVHIAYQDAIADMVMYTTYNGAPGTPELVDDGTRQGDRTHGVGAGAAIYLVGGAPVIAYQDGTSADVYTASRNGAGSWSTAPLAASPLLDGFSIAVTSFGGQTYFAWDQLDPAKTPANSVFVQKQ